MINHLVEQLTNDSIAINDQQLESEFQTILTILIAI